MRYVLLLHGDESFWETLTPEQMEAAIAEYAKYSAELEAAGVLVGGSELMPSHTATLLRGRDGVVEVTDGPYAETREQIGGFYVLDVPSIDEALAWARKCPALEGGCVEVRPAGTSTDDTLDA